MAGMLVLAGRAKDTIVLSNGENIEVVPISLSYSTAARLQHGSHGLAFGLYKIVCHSKEGADAPLLYCMSTLLLHQFSSSNHMLI